MISGSALKKNGIFTYKTQILDGQFVFIAEVHPNGEFKTQLVDILTQEQYTLHLVERREFFPEKFKIIAVFFADIIYDFARLHALEYVRIKTLIDNFR